MAFVFWKYHGLGNDFVIVDVRNHARKLDTAQVQLLCDRHCGIGADGVIFVHNSKDADFQMIIYNADGSRPEMCGNGLRCFVQYLADEGITKESTIRVETDRGILTCERLVGAGDVEDTIRVDMGRPMLECAKVPIRSRQETWIEQPLQVSGRDFVGTAVSMGNPHFVIFEKAGDAEREIAPQLESHVSLPQRANIEFVEQVSPSRLDVVVFERGVGFTQACGTGACAVGVAAVLTERVAPDEEVEVRLPGGALWIKVPADLSTVWMRGPATRLFSGRWEAGWTSLDGS